MKQALFLVLPLLMSTAAFAQQEPNEPQGGQGRPQNFQEAKQRMLDRIDQRLTTLQNARNCVAQAQDPQALRACRPERPEGGQPRQ